jgi:Big-like domain-containing protein
VKALCVSLLVVAMACGDSNGPGPQAASVTGIAGDNQSAARGTALPFPLTFTALGSTGQPIAGVSVSWSVTPTGAATFSAQTSQTDVNGVASTNVTLGATLGSLTIQATVSGVSPVTYHATVLDPCLVEAIHNVGETASGALTSSDCNFNNNGWYYDFYRLVLPPGQHNLRISMRSGTFDTWLDIYSRLRDSVIGFDDDSVLGLAQNAQFDVVLPGGTSYIIGANSFDQFTVGSYTLQTATRPAPMNGCRAVWLVRGVTVSDSITNSDCADSAATPRRYDVARMAVYGGTVLTINQRSTTLNPSLALYTLNPNTYARTLVVANDDSLAGSNTNAFIQYSVPANNYFDIIIGTSAGGETGTYTFEVSASTTLSPRVAAPLSRGRDGWWRDAFAQRSKR